VVDGPGRCPPNHGTSRAAGMARGQRRWARDLAPDLNLDGG
jgi:hypothetical protein